MRWALNPIKNSSFVKRNFVFGNLFMPIRKNKIRLFYWKYLFSPNNVGDLLSEVIFDFVTNDTGLDRKRKLSRTKKLSIVGSVIQILHNETIIWGSGPLTDYLNIGKSFDVRAVRGPLTKKLLERKGIKCPDIYGDPAILLPLFYKPQNKTNTSYIIIPNHAQLSLYERKYKNVVSPLTNDWKNFIDTICASELVVSSSLHGVILAESYGIPAIFLKEGFSDVFKYDDYYHSTMRFSYKKAKSVEDALRQGGMELPANLDKLRFDLLKSFPVDIFEDDNIKTMSDIKNGIISTFLKKDMEN
jgi:pyruvyltransferase